MGDQWEFAGEWSLVAVNAKKTSVDVLRDRPAHRVGMPSSTPRSLWTMAVCHTEIRAL